MGFVVSTSDNEKVPIKGFKQEIKPIDQDEELEIEKIMKAQRPCKLCDD